MNREIIIEIARYRKIEELICKDCGTVNSLESVSYEFDWPHVKAVCPECGAFLRWMPMHKAWRIFRSAKYGMMEIEELDNGFLNWYLNTVKKINPDLRNAIQQLIDRRTTDPAAFYVPPLDVDASKEIKLIERRDFLLENIVGLKSKMTRRAASWDPQAGLIETDKFIKWTGAQKLIIGNYEKELRRVNKNIKKIEDEK